MIISVEEARKIMGEEAENLTDVEMAKLIDDLDFLAREFIRAYKSGNISTK